MDTTKESAPVAGLSNGSVHTVDLSESKELSIEVGKGGVKVSKECGPVPEDRPAQIIRKLSEVGTLDEGAKALLTNLAESMGLEVIDNVSRKLSKGAHGKSPVTNDRIKLSASEILCDVVDNVFSKDQHKELDTFLEQLEQNLKVFTKMPSKTSTTRDKFAKDCEKIDKIAKILKRRRYEQFKSVSSQTGDESGHSRSCSESASLDSDNYRGWSRSQDQTSRSRSSYLSRTTASSCSGNRSSKSRTDRSDSLPQHRLANREPRHSQWTRERSSKRARDSETSIETEETSTACTVTDTDEDSTVTNDTIVPVHRYGLRPRYPINDSEEEYEQFRQSLNEVQSVLKKDGESSVKQNILKTEEDHFCEFLKLRLKDIEKTARRRVICKIHNLLENVSRETTGI